MKDLIKKLAGIPGPSGHEKNVRQAIRDEVSHYSDDIHEDQQGNLIVRVGKKSKDDLRIMVTGHMDEIGLIATHIDAHGFIRFATVGEVNLDRLPGGRVCFINGINGIIESEQTDHPKSVVELNRMFIDIGATSDKDHPVQKGDIAVIEQPCIDLGHRLAGKALSSRVGCAVMIEALRKIKPAKNEIVLVFTTQMEVGMRGATTSAYSVDPTIGISIDCTPAGDTPGDLRKMILLGKGPAIKVRDRSVLSHRGVIQWMENTAKSKHLRFQLDVQEQVNSDASAIQITRAGVPVGGISIPCRYVHSPSEMVDLSDIEQAVNLLVALLEKPFRVEDAG